jgi:hypothetical protein
MRRPGCGACGRNARRGGRRDRRIAVQRHQHPICRRTTAIERWLHGPLLFSGGCTVRCCVRVTTQSGHAFWSPTIDSTTGVKPALPIALCASEYFCPVTSEDELATATPPWLPVVGNTEVNAWGVCGAVASRRCSNYLKRSAFSPGSTGPARMPRCRWQAPLPRSVARQRYPLRERLPWRREWQAV